MRAADVVVVAGPHDADAEPLHAAAEVVHALVGLEDDHVAGIAALPLEEAAGGRSLLIRRHHLEEGVAHRHHGVVQTEDADAGIAIRHLDAEHGAEVVDDRLEIARDGGDLTQTHGPLLDQRRGDEAYSTVTTSAFANPTHVHGQEKFSGTTEVAERHRFDTAALERYLAEHVEGFAGPLTVRSFKGGQSNPTYQLETPNRSYVLRRKPPGKLLPSAHAVDREYRVMTAVAPDRLPGAADPTCCAPTTA